MDMVSLPSFLVIGIRDEFASPLGERVAKWLDGGLFRLPYVLVQDSESLTQHVNMRLGGFQAVVVEAVLDQDSAREDLVTLARKLLPIGTPFIRVEIRGVICRLTLHGWSERNGQTVTTHGVLLDDVLLDLLCLAGPVPLACAA